MSGFFCIRFVLTLLILKGIIHPIMKILTQFTYPQVVPNLYYFLSSAEQNISNNAGKKTFSH